MKMKIKKNILLSAAVLFCAMLLLNSCVDTSLPDFEEGKPVITSISHDTITIGDLLTIRGANLLQQDENSFALNHKILLIDVALPEQVFIINRTEDLTWYNNAIELQIPDSVPANRYSMQVSYDQSGTITSTSANTEIVILKADKIETVTIPAGIFIMGEDIGDKNEQPAHEVTLTRNFHISKYEVSQRVFTQVMDTNPSIFVRDDLPVHNVSRLEALEFCNKLSELNNLTLVYDLSNLDNIVFNVDANGWRIPTEAEWEYVCRAGSTSSYPISDDEEIEDFAWYNLNSGMKPHPSGKKLGNDFGVFDMCGNLYEWCWDYSASYTAEPQTDPIGPTTGSEFVVRGGSYIDGDYYLRSSNRKYSKNPVTIGLRLVRNEM